MHHDPMAVCHQVSNSELGTYDFQPNDILELLEGNDGMCMRLSPSPSTGQSMKLELAVWLQAQGGEKDPFWAGTRCACPRARASP